MAAIDYSLEKLVVHGRRTNDRVRCIRQYAAVQGYNKRLLHIPLASLSRETLKKIRVMHILAGKDKREPSPKSYVW